jgi:hypothetical protein
MYYCLSVTTINRETSTQQQNWMYKLVLGINNVSSRLDRCISTMSVSPRMILSKIVDLARVEPAQTNSRLRMAFRDIPMPIEKKLDSTHTHGSSAFWRSCGTKCARELANSVGMDIYVMQMSPTDQRENLRGVRDYYWPKDLAAKSKQDIITPNDILVMIDVDYYYDMKDFLLKHDNPVLIYTFVPDAAAYSEDEYNFHFVHSNTGSVVKYNVSGGAEYEHQLWNYGVDVICVSSAFKSKVYNIERRKMNANHQLLLLVPVGTWYFPFNCYGDLFPNQLDRLMITNEQHTILNIDHGQGVDVSISKVGMLAAAKIPKVKFDLAELAYFAASVKPTVPTLQPLIGSRDDALILLDYFRTTYPERTKLGSVTLTTVYDAPVGVRTYQFIQDNEELIDDLKPMLHAYMSPLIPNAFVPTNTVQNEARSIEGRVKRPGEEAKSIQLSSKSLLEFNELFRQYVLPHHLLDPVDYEEVLERQSRPTQRALLAQAELSDNINGDVSTFLKSEAYKGLKDPRTITTYCAGLKAEYAKFIYAIADHLKVHAPWYTAGKTPKEIAHYISYLCSDANYVIEGDFTVQDGHTSSIVREAECADLLFSFKPQYHDQISKLYKAGYNLTAKTKHGLKYKLEFQRGSGSMETSVLNSLNTYRIILYAYYLNGVKPQYSISIPIVVLGDDSLARDLPSKCLIKAARVYGQVIKAEIKQNGQAGVTYLSRVFTEHVWFGSPTSTCDIFRTLSKIHVTNNNNRKVSNEQLLLEKMAGLSLSDNHTIIIRSLLSTIKRLGYTLPMAEQGWWSKFDYDNNWPQNPSDLDDTTQMKQLSKYNANIEPLMEHLDNANTLAELLTCPAIIGLEELEPVAVDARVILGETIIEAKDSEPICHFYNQGKCTRGKKCQFAHIKVCKDYQINKCKRNNCKFAHRLAPITIPPKPRLVGIELNPGPGIHKLVSDSAASLMPNMQVGIKFETKNKFVLNFPKMPKQRKQKNATKAEVAKIANKVEEKVKSDVKKKWHTGLASKVGSVIGGSMFGAPGAALGDLAGKAFSKITGVGSYKISSNTLINGGQIPGFSKVADGYEISHREYCFDLYSGTNLDGNATNFSNRAYNITPTNSTLFPLLSQLAYYFQEFEIRGLGFEFKSTSSNALTSTNTALGTVMMATNYDPKAAPFDSKSELESYEGAISAKPADCCMHLVECKPRYNVLGRYYQYNSATLGSVDDIRFSSLGLLNVATTGMQAASVNLGEIWTTYHVRLFKPRVIMSADSHYFSSWSTGGSYTVPVGNGLGNPTAGTITAVQSGGMLGTVGPAGVYLDTTTTTYQPARAPVVTTFNAGVSTIEFSKAGYYRVIVTAATTGGGFTGTGGYIKGLPVDGLEFVNHFQLANIAQQPSPYAFGQVQTLVGAGGPMIYTANVYSPGWTGEINAPQLGLVIAGTQIVMSDVGNINVDVFEAVDLTNVNNSVVPANQNSVSAGYAVQLDSIEERRALLQFCKSLTKKSLEQHIATPFCSSDEEKDVDLVKVHKGSVKGSK